VSRRVVVTGIGLVSSLGIGTALNWQALTAGRSGIATITKFDATDFATRIAGEVKGFNPLDYIEKKDVKKMDVFIQYAIAASQFAMDDASLAITPELAPRVGVFIASGIGGFTTIEREHRALLEGGPRKISPFFIPSAIINLAVAALAMGLAGAKSSSEGREAASDSRDLQPLVVEDSSMRPSIYIGIALSGATALGAHGELVRDASELPGAIERALASGRPAVVNVMIESIPSPVVRR